MRTDNAPTAPADSMATLLDELIAGLDKPVDPAEAIDALIRRMRDENNLMPMPLLEILLATGSFPCNDLSVFKWVQLAPHYLVEGKCLRWNADTKKLMLQTGDGGWRLAEHALRLLLHGDQGASSGGFPPRPHWRFLENDDPSCGRVAYERLTPELGTVLRCIAREGSLDPYRAPYFQIIDVWDRWQLWDRRHICRASFDVMTAAMDIADLAIIGLSESHAFLDMHDSDDPGCS